MHGSTERGGMGTATKRDTRPHRARQGKRAKRIRKAGDLDDARRKLWQGITTAEAAMLDAADAGDPALTLRAVHALTQACTAYAKLTESCELEERVTELEARFDG